MPRTNLHERISQRTGLWQTKRRWKVWELCVDMVSTIPNKLMPAFAGNVNHSWISEFKDVYDRFDDQKCERYGKWDDSII